MSELTPVSFRKGREHLPRLSKPYDPGKRDKRYWTEAEEQILREWYPKGGLAACAARLPGHHSSKSSIYARVAQLGLHRSENYRPQESHDYGAEMDERIRQAWPLLDGKKRGAVNNLADSLGVPRWWLSKRARQLGLQVLVHKKEPPWTAAEEALLAKAPLHDLHLAWRFFRDHGFVRTETAIKIRAVRRGIRLRASRPTLSGREVAAMLGVDSKWPTARILAGDLVGTKRADRRLPQQGGHVWEIERTELRRFVIENLEQIDFRKVDKFAIVDLLTNNAAATAAAAETPTALPGVDETWAGDRTHEAEGPGELTGGVARTEASAVTAGETVQVEATDAESPAAEPGIGGAENAGGGEVPPAPPSSTSRRRRMKRSGLYGAAALMAARAAERRQRRHG